MQLYTPADRFADLQAWCYQVNDDRPFLPDSAWYVLQGQVFGNGLEALSPYLRFGNERWPGMRLVVYDAVANRVCAVGLAEPRTAHDWHLHYYFAATGARSLRVFEAALPTLTHWLVQQAAQEQADVRLVGDAVCAEDGCRQSIVYRATPAGELWVERDAVTYD